MVVTWDGSAEEGWERQSPGTAWLRRDGGRQSPGTARLRRNGHLRWQDLAEETG